MRKPYIAALAAGTLLIGGGIAGVVVDHILDKRAKNVDNDFDDDDN